MSDNENIDRITELSSLPVHLDTLAHFSTVMVPRIAREQAVTVVEQRDKDRQLLEDARANHRNFNRMLTLLGALLIGLFVTWSLSSGVAATVLGTHLAHVLVPYSFVITVLMDSTLAAYSLIKKY